MSGITGPDDYDCDASGADICPISIECRLVVPRKSIDVSRLQQSGTDDIHDPLDLCSSSSRPSTIESRAHISKPGNEPVAASRTASEAARAGPMSTDTPQQMMTADGRLSIATMMDHSMHSQSSNHGVRRMGSFSSKLARAASGRVSFSTLDRGGEPPIMPNDKAPMQSSNTAADVAQELQLSDQLQHLAVACRMRDTRMLQHLLAARVPVSGALDRYANTALHLVLLPTSCSSAATTGAEDGNNSLVPSTLAGQQHVEVDQSVEQLRSTDKNHIRSGGSSNSSGGAFGWLTACFTGSRSSSYSDVRCGSSLHCACSSHIHLSASAAALAQSSMAAALLAAGASVNVRNKSGITPLMLAAMQLAASSGSITNSYLKLLELLLTKDSMADVNLKDTAGRTALVHLLMQTYSSDDCTGHTSTAGGSVRSEPVTWTASANDRSIRSSLYTADASVSTSVRTAASAAMPSAATSAVKIKAVQLLVHHGADINAADAGGMTPLMHAAAQPAASKELLQKMLELGANSRLLDNKRRSALTHAMVAQQLQLVPAIGVGTEQYRASHNHQNHTHSASRYSCGNAVAVSAAAAAEAVQAGSGCTPVPGYYYAAAAAGMAANTAAACRQGSMTTDPPLCISSCDSAAGTQQRISADIGGVAAAQQASTSSSSSSSSGGTMQDGSTRHLNGLCCSTLPRPSHASVIRALCSYGALDLYPGTINTRFPGIDNYSQLHIAMRRGDVRAVQLLLASGAAVDALDSYGNSPLMYWPVAPTEPEELVLELAGELLAHGADPNLPNNDGWTALDLACELNKFSKVLVKPSAVPIHALLVGYGAKNSEAFLTQQKHQSGLLCMRTDSANSVLLTRSSKSYDSLRVAVPSSCGEPVMLPAAVLEEVSSHFE